MASGESRCGRIHFRESSAIVVFDTEILPSHIITEEIAPSFRDLRSACQDLGVVDEGKDLLQSQFTANRSISKIVEHTLRHSSSGRLVKGSFFSRGLTN